MAEKKPKGKMKNSKKAKEKPVVVKAKVERPRTNDGKKFSEHTKEFKEMLLRKKSALTHNLRTELRELEAPDKHHLADLEEMASDTTDTDSVCEIMALGASTIDQI